MPDMDLNAGTAIFCASIIGLCAPTLETLIWAGLDQKDPLIFGELRAHTIIEHYLHTQPPFIIMASEHPDIYKKSTSIMVARPQNL